MGLRKRNTKCLFLIVFLLLAVFCRNNSVQAASKSKNAKKAYKKYMENIYDKKEFKSYKGKDDRFGSIYFSVVDISGDKVPELIVKETYTYPFGYYIYTYKSGKMKSLKKGIGYYIGGEPAYIYPSKHLIECNEGDDWDFHTVYYKVGKKMKKISGVDISGAKKYSLSSGKYKMRKNTKKNRNKYLK